MNLVQCEHGSPQENRTILFIHHIPHIYRYITTIHIYIKINFNYHKFIPPNSKGVQILYNIKPGILN